MPSDCVLKLYDRRCGSCLRDVRYNGPALYKEENQAAFEGFVSRGLMPAFLSELKRRRQTDDIARPAYRFLDNPTSHGLALYEAAIWQECNEHFECETKAYDRLDDIQGTLIPRMLAHVCLPDTAPATIPQESSSYFELKGILLERIDGYCLRDLDLATPIPRDLPQRWQQLIQLAADAAHEINKRGIIMEDAAPRNVVVDRQSQTPRIIDLAQCLFRDELVSDWYEWEWHEDDDGWDPDIEYWEMVNSRHNPGAIAAVMMSLIRNETGVELSIRYPDYVGIYDRIRRGDKM